MNEEHQVLGSLDKLTEKLDTFQLHVETALARREEHDKAFETRLDKMQNDITELFHIVNGHQQKITSLTENDKHQDTMLKDFKTGMTDINAKLQKIGNKVLSASAGLAVLLFVLQFLPKIWQHLP